MKVFAAVRKHYKLIILFLLFAIGFVWLSLISPDNRPVLAEARLTHAQIIILILAVVLPYVGVWLVGLAGYIWLHDYASLIGKKDGAALLRMVRGILGVLISLPIMSINNTLVTILQSRHMHNALLIRRVGLYVVIAILLWSFYTLMRSTHTMLGQLKPTYIPMPSWVVLAVMLLGGLYVYFVLTNPLFESNQTRGYLPSWVVIDTIVLPRLLAWYWGVHAVWNLYQYARAVPGRIYRLAFSYLSVGVGVVTVTIILLQYLQAISVVTTLPISVLLLIVYVFLVIASAGFMLVARGGKELAKIEQV